ncbi:hypothetical protein, partial [Escherichia coli]|uniref:hypothetical protein n=1 Tax=Escherichia coli TaxID=562 RepID=UPI001BC8C07B
MKVVNFKAVFFMSFVELISLKSCTDTALLLNSIILLSVDRQKEFMSMFIIFKQKQTSFIAISRS